MKKTLKRFAMLSVAMLLAFAGCEDDPIIEDLVNTDLPTIITNEVSDITANGAKTGGYVSAQGGTEVVARGVCYSTTQNPTVGNSRTEDGQGMGGFTSILTGLTPATTYYIRAYATNQHGTAYGEERSFTTAEGTGDTGDTTQGEDGKPVVTTKVVAIGCISAKCGGNVVSEELVLARGICWSTSPNPTINNTFTNEGQGAGNFTSSMTELSPNTTYYVRAYATNVNGTSYGEEKSFMTSAGTGSINGYDWVDLGLPSALKWATCNVGAATPEDYGNYYAWGETTTKSEYTEENSVTYGQQISDFSGNPTYDAARANWGSTWRMPTKTEMQELRNNCTWTWTAQNGVNGMRVTGPSGNSIFLPAAGYCEGSSRNYVGGLGYYWSSTPDDVSLAYGLNLTSGGYIRYVLYRYKGYTVRPVSD